MHTTDHTNTNQSSISSVLFHATFQLTLPVQSSTYSMTKQIHSKSDSEEYYYNRKSRFHLSSLSISFPKCSRLNNRTFVRDSSHTPTKDYLTIDNHYQFSRSTSCSSVKSTYIDIWQGLSNNDIPSTSIKPKHFQECVRRARPRWRAFSKVVAALLTFTRTKRGRYEWIQLVGHPETFKEGTRDGFVLKTLVEDEQSCYEKLQNDFLKEFVPKYIGTRQDDDGKLYIELEDLLASFHEPCIMDCKIGTRTYLEEELDKSESDPKPRADLYKKMIAIDPLEPTDEEKTDEKILKPRYMIWRESLSSTQDLGFRIEAIKKSRGLMSKEFQRVKQRNHVKNHFLDFIARSPLRATTYLNRLRELRTVCLSSEFIRTHELIGSSILFIHDENKASLWMIDFGKTRPLPANIHITHFQPWTRGSHEDGYLFGLDNLISIFQELVNELRTL